jgi:CspA family cold shock protein
MSSQRHTGRVKWFNPAKGYGFVERNDESGDIFLAAAELSRAGVDPLEVRKDDLVEFAMVADSRGRGFRAVSPLLIVKPDAE